MILKNSVLIAIFSILSVLLGILRDRLLATYVGVGPMLDLYNASFRIPDLLYGMLLAFITSATVVPFLTKEDKHNKIKDPLNRLTTLTSLFLTVITVTSCVTFFIIPYIAKYIVPGFTEVQLQEYVTLTRLLLIQPIFLGLASLTSCYAQLRNEFILYGVSPLLYSAGIIFGVVALYPNYGVRGLIYGVVFGAIMSFLLQAFSLRSLRLHHLKHVFSFSLTKEAIFLALPRTGTNIITQGRVIVFHAFATTLGPGYLSAYLFALRITEAVTQIIQQSLTTASIPVLSKFFAENNTTSFKEAVHRYTWALFGVGIVASAFLYFFMNEVVAILYGSGDKNAMIVFFLAGALIALPFQMVSGYLSISLYSAHDTKRVMVSYLFASSLAVGILFSKIVSGPPALIIANTLFWVLLCAFLGIMYRNKKFK